MASFIIPRRQRRQNVRFCLLVSSTTAQRHLPAGLANDSRLLLIKCQQLHQSTSRQSVGTPDNSARYRQLRRLLAIFSRRSHEVNDDASQSARRFGDCPARDVVTVPTAAVPIVGIHTGRFSRRRYRHSRHMQVARPKLATPSPEDAAERRGEKSA